MTLRTTEPLFVDDYRRNRTTGSFVLIDETTHQTAAAGMIALPSDDRAGTTIVRTLIFHEATGSGPVVLFTHGFGASSHMWGATVEDLSADHTTIVWDMLGHGRSDSPADPAAYSVASSLDAMLGILDGVSAERAALVGHSLGGYLSLELAIAHPDRVAALVLVDTGPGYRSDRGRDEWNEMAERYASDLDERGLDGLPGSDELTADVHPMPQDWRGPRAAC